MKNLFRMVPCPLSEKPPSKCEYYRPIPLLNYNTKIIAKVLAPRLKKCLPSVIHIEENGFIKNHQAYYNIRKTFKEEIVE